MNEHTVVLSQRGGPVRKTTPVAGPAALRLTWVPVTQSDGHVRMEMRWQAPRRIEKVSAA